MGGLFDPDTESELKKIFQALPRELNDILVVSSSSEEHDHHEDEEEHHHHHGDCPTCDEAKVLAE
ncbi:MAG: hypothetical protein QW726_03690, partial [Fervidicoccaceae archaeon]